MTGTYLGKKKIFNLEAGFIAQNKATWSTPNTGVDTVYHDLRLWSVAAFYDTSVGSKGAALNAYVGYFNMNYGQNYLRYNGIMNPANGLQTGKNYAGFGNQIPMFGTGQMVYSQIGYLLPASFLGNNHGQLMPYASVTYAKFNRLSSPNTMWDMGASWLIENHNSKISIDYQIRPI